MTEAIRIHRFGGPEQLQLATVPTGEPASGQVHIRQTHIGVNYIDIYFRTGLYPPASMPFTPGLEGAGEVVAVGDGVTGLSPGQRVAYVGGPPGAYASERIIAADRVVALPNAVSSEQAAAMMLKGLTAHMLLQRVCAVQSGDRVLIHAAAGGVGLLLCQWAHHLGATVIGTVGSPEKAELARANGCDHPILYRDEDVAERVRAITGGAGVRVAYDSVGADTLATSLGCVAKRGLLVSFGQSSGIPPAIAVGQLAAGGSLFLTRPSLFDYIGTAEELQSAARALFARVADGSIRVRIDSEWPLAEAAGAHERLASRQSSGSIILRA
ncbi:quinone oxidoreductase family protein [Spiribacter vilamensis]|uniref:NADPH:quinone reductase n=1 Tax=Spiribacter vilamensis TaxID=531306 RepID=A0A4Q8D275_9GAMM|nr:quinone oxidoreductase [Spiribacter vilamensis]RZU99488.1 NADPH2:quinone reductase [Spiribacter vilamensis]TVO61540.1 quinone oxidoreductase [Spiribacter vilamensis]